MRTRLASIVRRSLGRAGFVGLSALLAVIAVVASQLMRPAPSQQTSTQPVITRSSDTPDESKKNAQRYNWTGAPAEPKKIRITKIDVDAFVQKAGVDQNNQVAVPNNVHLAGWFNQSALPGQQGLSIIAGHVSGVTTDGIFKQLAKLQSGDEFEIERGDGVVLKYKVTSTVKVPEAKAAAYLFSQDPGTKSQLNLITCAGTYDKSVRRFQDRVIVSSALQ